MKIKNIKFIILSLFFIAGVGVLAGCKINEGFIIKGNITGEISGKVYLVHEYNQHNIIDSTTINNGKFTFTGSVPEPVSAYIAFPNGQQIEFFIENSTINIRANADSIYKANISGSEMQDLWNAYLENLSSLHPALDRYYKFRDSVLKSYNYKPNAETNSLIKAETDKVVGLDFKLEEDFFSKHATSNICAYALFRHYEVPYLHSYSVSPLFNRFSDKVKNSYYGKKLEAILNAQNKSSIGSHPEFAIKDINGNTINLSSFKGRYVLVDFWASWCAPCRKQNPTLTANYKKYHAEGFDIIGISLDTKKAAWIKAIKDDGITWTQISDLKEWEKSAAVVDFGVEVIPANFLLDKEGKVIAKDLHDEELRNKLKLIFGK